MGKKTHLVQGFPLRKETTKDTELAVKAHLIAGGGDGKRRGILSQERRRWRRKTQLRKGGRNHGR